MHCLTPAEDLAQNIPQLRIWIIRLTRKHCEQDINANFLPHLPPIFRLFAWSINAFCIFSCSGL